jgi:hypothetical protein
VILETTEEFPGVWETLISACEQIEKLSQFLGGGSKDPTGLVEMADELWVPREGLYCNFMEQVICHIGMVNAMIATIYNDEVAKAYMVGNRIFRPISEYLSSSGSEPKSESIRMHPVQEIKSHPLWPFCRYDLRLILEATESVSGTYEDLIAACEKVENSRKFIGKSEKDPTGLTAMVMKLGSPAEPEITRGHAVSRSPFPYKMGEAMLQVIYGEEISRVYFP